MRKLALLIVTSALTLEPTFAQDNNQATSTQQGRRLKERPGRIIGTCEHEEEVLRELQKKYIEVADTQRRNYGHLVSFENEKSPEAQPIYNEIIPYLRKKDKVFKKLMKWRNVLVDEQHIDCSIACGRPCK